MEFDSFLEEFSPLNSLKIQNQVNNFKFGIATKGSIDQILDLKRQCLYDYIQNIIFLGQGNPKNFLNSRCLLYGPANVIDTMRRMQPKGDLEGAWLMFNNYKHVQ